MIKKCFILLLSLAPLSVLAHGQDLPAVTGPVSYQGFQLPSTLGMLSYALTASESGRTGYYGNGGETWSTNISGDLAYNSVSDVHPFRMTYSGGYLHTNGGGGNQPSTVFQDLSASQSFRLQRWSLTLSDNLSYLPDSAVGGLSGVDGVGDVGVTTGPPIADQGILSGYAQRISNSSSLSGSRQLTGSTGLEGSGSYTLQRFLGDNTGLFDVDGYVGSGGISHRLNALSGINVDYHYSHFSYPGQNFPFMTQGATLGYHRRFTRRLSGSVSGGPEITSRSGSSLSAGSVNFSASAGLSYGFELGTAGLSYVRGVQSGSGIVQGSIADSFSATASRTLGRFWHGGAEMSYSRNASIAALTSTPFVYNTVTASIQVNRVIAENLSCFASYGVQNQDLNNNTSANIFSGLTQTFAFGITYSPRARHLGHQ